MQVIQKRIAERQRFKRGEATLSNDSKLNGRPKTIHIADSDLNPKLGKCLKVSIRSVRTGDRTCRHF